MDERINIARVKFQIGKEKRKKGELFRESNRCGP